jgi:transaldolase
MIGVSASTDLAREIRDFLRKDFKPRFGAVKTELPTSPLWRRLRELGTDLWLDTGSIAETEPLWTREFSALTTNNTLLNKEIQTGRYDGLIACAAAMLVAHRDLSDKDRMLELAFILNAYHGLRLVERFDAYEEGFYPVGDDAGYPHRCYYRRWHHCHHFPGGYGQWPD